MKVPTVPWAMPMEIGQMLEGTARGGRHMAAVNEQMLPEPGLAGC
jgi:hypothetical protein